MGAYNEPTVSKTTLVCLLHSLKDFYIFDIGFHVRNFRSTIKEAYNLTTCCCPCGNSHLWLDHRLGKNKLCIPENDECKQNKWYTYHGLLQHLKGSNPGRHPYGWLHFAILTYLSKLYSNYYPPMPSNPYKRVDHIMHYHSSDAKHKREKVKQHMLQYVEQRYDFDMSSIIQNYEDDMKTTSAKTMSNETGKPFVDDKNIDYTVDSPSGMIVSCSISSQTKAIEVKSSPQKEPQSNRSFSSSQTKAKEVICSLQKEQQSNRSFSSTTYSPSRRFDHYGPSSNNHIKSAAKDYICERNIRAYSDRGSYKHHSLSQINHVTSHQQHQEEKEVVNDVVTNTSTHMTETSVASD